jgi:hypothetical protein
MRRIISEFKGSSNDLKRTYSQPERDAYKRGRQDVQGNRQHPQDRAHSQVSTSFKPTIPRYTRPNQGTKPPTNNGTRGQAVIREQVANQGDRFRKYGKETDTKRRRPEDKRAYGAFEQDDDEDDEPQDLYSRDGKLVFSATSHQQVDDDDDGEDRHAMMGKRDYDFNGFDEDDEGTA